MHGIFIMPIKCIDENGKKGKKNCNPTQHEYHHFNNIVKKNMAGDLKCLIKHNIDIGKYFFMKLHSKIKK